MTHVWHVLTVMFAWPDGILVGNLLAEVVVFAAGVLVGRRALQRIHHRLDQAHAHRQELHRMITDLHAHHLPAGQEGPTP